MARKDDFGRAGEQRVVRHLHSLGWQVLDRNWRSTDGEIDIVADSGREVIVVEVKTRRSDLYGHPFEAIDERKRRRLWRLAMAWVAAHPEAVQGRRLRVDAVGLIGADPDSAVLEHLRDIA